MITFAINPYLKGRFAPAANVLSWGSGLHLGESSRRVLLMKSARSPTYAGIVRVLVLYRNFSRTVPVLGARKRRVEFNALGTVRINSTRTPASVRWASDGSRPRGGGAYGSRTVRTHVCRARNAKGTWHFKPAAVSLRDEARRFPGVLYVRATPYLPYSRGR